jgi:hypothetical protein
MCCVSCFECALSVLPVLCGACAEWDHVPALGAVSALPVLCAELECVPELEPSSPVDTGGQFPDPSPGQNSGTCRCCTALVVLITTLSCV